MKLIFLMKDYSVKYSINIEKHYKDIQFILFPCDIELNTYLLVEPNQYMLKMKKAKIIVESVVQRCGYDYKDHHYPMGRVEKIVYNYPDLIQYLFSIEKTKYYNKVMQMSDYSDIPLYMTIQYCFFSIRLYDEHNKVIFKKKINVGEEVSLSEIYISQLFGPGNITNNVKDIFFAELSLFKECISIDPIHCKWDLGHDDYKYSICALWLDESNSISFFHRDIIKKFSYIDSIYVDVNTFAGKKWENVEHRGVINSPMYDLLYFDFQLILEYIIYLPYINLITRMCAKLANDEYNQGELKEDDYVIYLYIELEVYHKVHKIHRKDTNPYTVEDLIQLLEGD